MHVSVTKGNAIARIEVVARAKTHHKSEGEILPLRQCIAMRALRVDEPGSAAQLKVRCCPPVLMDEISPHTQIESPVSRFRSSRDRSEGQAQSQIGVAAQNRRAIQLAHLPAERRDYGYKSVVKRALRVVNTNESVEWERNVEWQHTHFLGEFELVSVIDVSVEISPIRVVEDSDHRFSL